MKIYTLLLYSVLLLLSGCSESNCRKSSSIASDVAKCYAAIDGVDVNEMNVYSSTEYENGATSVVDAGRTDDYARSLQKPLFHEKYVEICLRPKVSALGGEVCYFVKKGSNELLTVHKGP
jgi:hypothetical protein